MRVCTCWQRPGVYIVDRGLIATMYTNEHKNVFFPDFLDIHIQYTHAILLCTLYGGWFDNLFTYVADIPEHGTQQVLGFTYTLCNNKIGMYFYVWYILSVNKTPFRYPRIKVKNAALRYRIGKQTVYITDKPCIICLKNTAENRRRQVEKCWDTKPEMFTYGYVCMCVCM